MAGCAADGKVIYAGTRDSGVYGSDDGGRTWASQPASAAGETVNWLAVQPDNCNVAYAATWGTGVIKTENGGAEWIPVNDGLGDLFLYVLAIDPGDTRMLYAGTASDGVYKSANGGGTWFPASNGLPAGALVDALVIQPISPTMPLSQSIVFAGTWGSGVYASLDGAAAWLPANNGLGDLEVYALAVGSSSAQVIYAGTHEGGVYRGEMGGYSWVQDGLPGQAAYTVAVAEDGVAYAGTDGTSDGNAVYVRPVAGVWEPMKAQPGAPVVSNLALRGSSLLAGTTDGVWWYGSQ